MSSLDRTTCIIVALIMGGFGFSSCCELRKYEACVTHHSPTECGAK